jgi:hypothetical protein
MSRHCILLHLFCLLHGACGISWQCCACVWLHTSFAPQWASFHQYTRTLCFSPYIGPHYDPVLVRMKNHCVCTSSCGWGVALALFVLVQRGMVWVGCHALRLSFPSAHITRPVYMFSGISLRAVQPVHLPVCLTWSDFPTGGGAPGLSYLPCATYCIHVCTDIMLGVYSNAVACNRQNMYTADRINIPSSHLFALPCLLVM